MPRQSIYTLDWSGKRLNELMAAVGIPDEDFCRELGLKPHGLARWREEGVPKKYMKRVAKLLGWNLVYPDFDKAPIGTWVKKQRAVEQKSEIAPEGFRIAEPEEISSVAAGFKELVEAVTQKKVNVLIQHEPIVAPKIPLIRQPLEEVARQQIVATPTLEQKPRKPVGFVND